MEKYKQAYDFDALHRVRAGGNIAGTDEAGRGPLAGPVVAAAVVLNESDTIEGVGDSKTITPEKRNRLYAEITKRASAWAVSIIDPETIDRINILQASLLAMQNSLNQLTVPWNLVLVDGNQLIPSLPSERQLTVIKGDAKSAAIGAASILAKVTRDRIMETYDRQYPLYDFKLHKGYPTARHRELLVRYGLCPIHRKSFCRNFVPQNVLAF